jgi:hypothetical protein
MAYLLRALIVIMVMGIFLTVTLALGWWSSSLSHIQLAIPAFIFLMFIQAFVMFYFIGVARLVENVWMIISTQTQLEELFDTPPADLTPYKEQTQKFYFDSQLSKRQTIPWTILMLILGSIGFLLGGAHDTGLVSKVVHAGVIYGFTVAMLIGFVRQWFYLGKAHRLLRELKTLYSLSDDAM